MDTIATMLARAMAEQGNLGVTETARRLDVGRPTVYGWLRGQKPSTPDHIDRFCAFTGEDKIDVMIAAGWLTREDLAALPGAVTEPYPLPASDQRFREGQPSRRAAAVAV